MSKTLDLLVNAFRDVLAGLEADYRESSRNPASQLEWEVYKRVYKLTRLGTSDAVRKDVLFVDSGFRTYETDVSSVTYIQLGGLYRDVAGELKPLVRGRDTVIVSVSRIRSGNKYNIRTRVKSVNSKVIASKPPAELMIDQELTKMIRKLYPKGSENPRTYRRFLKYLTALVELSYALKLYDMLKQEHSLDPLVVIDGTLMRWFAVKRKALVDGVDVLSTLTELDEKTVIKHLMNVIGLSKSSKTTNLLRVRRLVKENGFSDRDEVYGLFGGDGLKDLTGIMSKYVMEEELLNFMREHIKIYNRIVYHVRGIWIVRVPVVTAGMSVYMVDVHSLKPVIDFNGNTPIINKDALEEANKKLIGTVPPVFAFRSEPLGAPPYGFMEVDQAVRIGGDEAKTVDTAFVKSVSSSGTKDIAWAFALMSSSVLRRYGYRWGA